MFRLQENNRITPFLPLLTPHMLSIVVLYRETKPIVDREPLSLAVIRKNGLFGCAGEAEDSGKCDVVDERFDEFFVCFFLFGIACRIGVVTVPGDNDFRLDDVFG
ncbi:hypothetical protein BT96DRAFT_916470 [Gymnopus androsaceus JB14]|uniref:Uncharacterized protein n=1 Tax=Gymnopus androsaceus JB14 TaxID=1447944 RepID=A0A6A4I7I5_9AGAR|nr:hypothetical protein BT96DRAFT_916470 [Gymnopus androsaceus JB14]